MFDFLTQNALYVVLIIVLICWFGILAYIFKLDTKISSLEKRMQKKGHS